MSQPPNNLRKYLRFSTIGLEMGFAVLIGLYVGQTLDKWLGTEPWLLLLFVLFGVAAAFRNLYRLLMELQRDESQSAQEGTPDEKQKPGER